MIYFYHTRTYSYWIITRTVKIQMPESGTYWNQLQWEFFVEETHKFVYFFLHANAQLPDIIDSNLFYNMMYKI